MSGGVFFSIFFFFNSRRNVVKYAYVRITTSENDQIFQRGKFLIAHCVFVKLSRSFFLPHFRFTKQPQSCAL